MRLLITGICGFVGKSIATYLLAHRADLQIVGIDNLSRPGSWINRTPLEKLGVDFRHGDLRTASDLGSLGKVDWVIDAAAVASVLAGVNGKVSSRQLVEHNLLGTLNVLELCRVNNAGLILLSTSRVYSISALSALPLTVQDSAFALDTTQSLPKGVSRLGIAENFSTAAPVSLYGATKLASEQLALEYAEAFGFPVLVNRCGVLAGGGQFGKADQGIFAFWLHSHHQRAPLRMFGFGGHGHQVRDCLHPQDLAKLIARQLDSPERGKSAPVTNVSGGSDSARSLAQVTRWCDSRWGRHQPTSESAERAYDLPWVVLDNARAKTIWDWSPTITVDQILTEIAVHAENHPEWLELSNGR